MPYWPGRGKRDGSISNGLSRSPRSMRWPDPVSVACIGCGPGVSERPDEVTVSAINRNYKGRSGPGRLWLASPLTVAASAFTGKITAYRPGMFHEAERARAAS